MSKKIYMLLFAFLLTAGIASAQRVVIRVTPPRPVRVGVIGHPPGPGYVWIEGYQEWRGDDYVWVPGRWVLPPRRHARWIRPRYRHVHGGWVFVAGRWR
jgi:WXXGXW repeat (2 copies)